LPVVVIIKYLKGVGIVLLITISQNLRSYKGEQHTFFKPLGPVLDAHL